MFDSGLQLTDVFALLGVNLVLCAGLLALLTSRPGAADRTAVLRWVTLIFFALMWIPVGAAHLPIVAYVRGITADLSITLIALAVLRISHHLVGVAAVPKRDLLAVMAAVAAAALVLYPTALGWGDWDAYRLGWGSWGMLLALLLLCVTCVAKGVKVLPALVALALMAWSLGLAESGNLWDYLLDPWLSVFSLGYVVHQVFVKRALTLRSRFR